MTGSGFQAAARWHRSLGAGAVALALAACGEGGTTLTEASAGQGDWQWSLPAFFPTPSAPESNPMTTGKFELGRFLFYEPKLSGNGTQSCGSCHHQEKSFTDGLAQAVGSTGELHPRGAQSLVNVAFNATLTWANPALVTLERQMETPLFGETPVEMGVNDNNQEAVLQRLRDDASYPGMFAAAFPGQSDPIEWGNIISSIAVFQRALISGNSRYDQYLQGTLELEPAETRGMNLFFGEKAECFHCHGSFNFNDQIVHARSRVVETPFHNTGLYNVGGTDAFPEPNRGVYELSGRAEDMGRFRAPSLRNVEVTAPYMHDGTIATLEEVVATYAAGGRLITEGAYAGDGRANRYKSDLVSLIDLSADEQSDIVAFLKSLTDNDFLTDPRFADPF